MLLRVRLRTSPHREAVFHAMFLIYKLFVLSIKITMHSTRQGGKDSYPCRYRILLPKLCATMQANQERQFSNESFFLHTFFGGRIRIGVSFCLMLTCRMETSTARGHSRGVRPLLTASVILGHVGFLNLLLQILFAYR